MATKRRKNNQPRNNQPRKIAKTRKNRNSNNSSSSNYSNYSNYNHANYNDEVSDEELQQIHHAAAAIFSALNPHTIVPDQIEVSHREGRRVSVEIRRCRQEEQHVDHWYPEAVVDLEEKDMHIEILTPCNDLKGKEILEGFTVLARQLGMRTMSLDDASTVYYPTNKYSDPACSVSLTTLEILQSGQSWYQRQGFNNITNRNFLRHNITTALMPFGEFMAVLLEKGVENQHARIDRETREAIQQVQRIMPPAQWRAEFVRLEEEKQERHANVRRNVGLIAQVREHFPEVLWAAPARQVDPLRPKMGTVSEALEEMIKVVQEIETCQHEALRVLQEVARLSRVGRRPLVMYDGWGLVKTL